MKKLLLLPLLILTLSGYSIASETSMPGDTPEQEAYRDLKYGAFIHWNHSAIMGELMSWHRDKLAKVGKEAEYDALRAKLKGERFDPDKWATMLKDAGFTYAVIVPKHHDGFCLFDTKTTDNNIINLSPFGKDYIALLAPALRKQGIKVCLYYSITDWTEPTYSKEAGANLDAYEKVMYGQLDELFSNYGEITAIWFDGHWDPSWTVERGRKLYKFIKSKQPKCLVSNRVGPKSHHLGPIGDKAGNFYSQTDKIGDYLTPEAGLGNYYLEYPWESCIAFDTHPLKWSWMPDGGFQNRSKKDLLRWLTECMSGGGNLLLGICPNEYGEFDPYHAEGLMEIGTFLKLHGEAYYGTRPGPYKAGSWPGAALYKGNKLYLHIFDMADGTRKLTLPPLGAKVLSYKLLTGTVDRHNTNYSVNVEQTNEALNVTLHPLLPEISNTILELTLDKPIKDLPLIDTGNRDHLKTITPRQYQ